MKRQDEYDDVPFDEEDEDEDFEDEEDEDEEEEAVCINGEAHMELDLTYTIYHRDHANEPPTPSLMKWHLSTKTKKRKKKRRNMEEKVG